MVFKYLPNAFQFDNPFSSFLKPLSKSYKAYYHSSKKPPLFARRFAFFILSFFRISSIFASVYARDVHQGQADNSRFLDYPDPPGKTFLFGVELNGETPQHFSRISTRVSAPKAVSAIVATTLRPEGESENPKFAETARERLCCFVRLNSGKLPRWTESPP